MSPTSPTPTLDLPTLRRKLALTQDALATKLGISTRTIRRWEAGAPMHLIWQERVTALYRKRYPRETQHG